MLHYEILVPIGWKSIIFILFNWGSTVNMSSLYLVTTYCPLPSDSFQQFLAVRILQAESLQAHWAFLTSLGPFKNALQMVFVLAASNSGRFIFTKRFKADATRIITRILSTALYKFRRR
jgi:hypothetical protein